MKRASLALDGEAAHEEDDRVRRQLRLKFFSVSVLVTAACLCVGATWHLAVRGSANANAVRTMRAAASCAAAGVEAAARGAVMSLGLAEGLLRAPLNSSSSSSSNSSSGGGHTTILEALDSAMRAGAVPTSARPLRSAGLAQALAMKWTHLWHTPSYVTKVRLHGTGDWPDAAVAATTIIALQVATARRRPPGIITPEHLQADGSRHAGAARPDRV